MAINIIDHAAAYLRLGDALAAAAQARVILHNTNTSAEIRGAVTAAEDKLRQARSTINAAIMAQAEESTP